MHLILASGSPRRRELLLEAGYEFDIIAPHDDVEKGLCSNCGPAELVAELAMMKARHVVEQLSPEKSPCIVLAADTVAECDGQILGKPKDEDHARLMLQTMSGKQHRVYTGVCVWPVFQNSSSKPVPNIQVAITTLRMDNMSDEQLDEYLDSGQWQGKAGAFGYQDRLGWVHIIEGTESNVVGLPMDLVPTMLTNAGL